ncbi:ATP-binding protein [Mesorhizobium amorphae]|uniref:ATP-binding protein n=1 Tax=Mesorhizobium amorphae TaxID=71433 RepID=UPI0024E139DE|nr:DUF4143 domain-containing protein [Mesorhizobium amorphae]
MLAGGYPEIRVLDERARQRRYRDYVDIIVDRDVADLLKIRKNDSMRRLIDQLAARTASEVNLQDLPGKIGIQRPTLETYIDVLIRLSLVARLPAWISGEVGRDIRRPKAHMTDTGIVAALRGMGPRTFLADANTTGPRCRPRDSRLHRTAQECATPGKPVAALSWRDCRGREIDILAEAGRTLVAFEMKAAATVEAEDFQHIRCFRETGPGSAWTVIGIVLYLGDRILSFEHQLYALPLSVFWAFPNGEGR